MLSLEEIKKAVVKACSNFDCIYAILFGSRAISNAKEYSDIDIAVKFKDSSNSLNKALNIMSIIEEELNTHVDVVPLNIADTIIKYEVYSQGIILFNTNNDIYMDDYINAIDEYLDFEYIFNKFYKIIVDEIKDASTRS
ncbi:MAG: nucleotidyltransferase domain-containing protein [Nitrososphaerota archaeon]